MLIAHSSPLPYTIHMTRVLTGPNLYAMQNELQKIVSEFRSIYGDGVERFDAQEARSDDILNAVRTLSLFDTNKLVLVRDFAQSKDLLEVLPTIVEQTSDTVQLVLIDPRIDKRSTHYLYLKKNTEIKEFKPTDPNSLVNWVVGAARDLGGIISTSDARYLVERVGVDELQLSKELEKLVTHDDKITRSSIDDLTDMSPQSSIFSMLEALFKGDGSSAWRLYQEQRTLGEDPHKILAMITWQLQQLTLGVYAPTPALQSLTENGMSSYSAQKTLRATSSLSKSRLKYYIAQLFEIDLQIKTSADVESALAVYFADVTSTS